MKKTIICALPFRWKKIDKKYLITSQEDNGYLDKEVFLPISHIIGNEVSKEDNVRIVLIETCSEKRDTSKFVQTAKEEFSAILLGYCATLEFEVIQVPFLSTKQDLASLYKKICSTITPESSCFADVTFGERYILMLIFCCLNYAEKFLDCEVCKLVYGRSDGETKNPGWLIDFTPLYLLNSFGSYFDGKKETFDAFVDKVMG